VAAIVKRAWINVQRASHTMSCSPTYCWGNQWRCRKWTWALSTALDDWLYGMNSYATHCAGEQGQGPAMAQMLVGKLHSNCKGTHTFRLFPIWKAHQIDIVENTTESLKKDQWVV
jgi:hypothetical protein